VNGEIGGYNLLRDFAIDPPHSQLLVGAFQPALFVRRFSIIESRRIGWIDGSQRIVSLCRLGFLFRIGITFNVHTPGCIGHARHLYRTEMPKPTGTVFLIPIPNPFLSRRSQASWAVTDQQVFVC